MEEGRTIDLVGEVERKEEDVLEKPKWGNSCIVSFEFGTVSERWSGNWWWFCKMDGAAVNYNRNISIKGCSEQERERERAVNSVGDTLRKLPCQAGRSPPTPEWQSGFGYYSATPTHPGTSSTSRSALLLSGLFNWLEGWGAGGEVNFGCGCPRVSCHLTIFCDRRNWKWAVIGF